MHLTFDWNMALRRSRPQPNPQRRGLGQFVGPGSAFLTATGLSLWRLCAGPPTGASHPG